MKIIELLLEDESEPYVITPGHPKNWRKDETDANVWVTLKNKEPRGIPASVMKSLGMALVDEHKLLPKLVRREKPLDKKLNLYRLHTGPEFKAGAEELRKKESAEWWAEEQKWEKELEAWRVKDRAAQPKTITKLGRDHSVFNAYTPIGRQLAKAIRGAGWNAFKPTGLVLKFKEGVSQAEALKNTRALLDKFIAIETKAAEKLEKHRKGAPERKREAAKFDREVYKKARQELFDKYGKRNVESVTARQIGGDDGHQWNVLINGQSMVDGLTLSQVPHYKREAYERLLQKNGKR